MRKLLSLNSYKRYALSLRNFGVFVDLGGVEGLVRIYELAHHPIPHPRDMFQVGDEINVQILHIDYEGLRISLSHKATLPNQWDIIVIGVSLDAPAGRLYGGFVDGYPLLISYNSSFLLYCG